MNHGQIIFLGFAGLILLWQIIKGWRLGLVRQIVRFAAIGAAYAAAYMGAASVVPFLKPLGYPNFVLLGIAGAVIWLAVYLFLAGLGAILFKRTANQDLGIVWFFYGVSGALLGAVFGLVLVLVVADMVRFCGSFAEGVASNTKKTTFFASEMIEVKQGIEKSPAGEILKTIDPLPKRTYAMAEKFGRVLSNVEYLERFLTFPGSRELGERPDIQVLHTDPDVLAALRDGRYQDLVKNPKIVRAIDDPRTAELFRRFEWEKALDYALEKKK